jgi:hypothetical protein
VPRRPRSAPEQPVLPGLTGRRRIGSAEKAASLDLRRLRAQDALMPNATAVEQAYRLEARILDETVTAGERYTALMAARRLQEIHAYLTGRADTLPSDIDPFALSSPVVDPTFS